MTEGEEFFLQKANNLKEATEIKEGEATFIDDEQRDGNFSEKVKVHTVGSNKLEKFRLERVCNEQELNYCLEAQELALDFVGNSVFLEGHVANIVILK